MKYLFQNDSANYIPLDDSRVLDGESTTIVTALAETHGKTYGCAVQVNIY